MEKEYDHNTREQLFSIRKEQLIRSAMDFISAADWFTSEFTDVVQKPNIEAAKNHMNAMSGKKLRSTVVRVGTLD